MAMNSENYYSLQSNQKYMSVSQYKQFCNCEAAAMAQRLADCGIKGIWNFTNMEFALNRPDVEVESVHFADSLLTLSYMISEE